MNDRIDMHGEGEDGDLRDPTLRRALDHAPDRDAAPDARTREAILKMAHNLAAAPVATPASAANSASAAPWWRRLFGGGDPHARMPWNAAFATVLVAAFVTVLWHREPIPDARLDGEANVASAPAPVQTPAPAPVAPAAASAPPQAESAPQPPAAAARREATAQQEATAQAPAERARDAAKEAAADAVRKPAPASKQIATAPEKKEARSEQLPLPAPAAPAAPAAPVVPPAPVAPAVAQAPPVPVPPSPAIVAAAPPPPAAPAPEFAAEASGTAELAARARQKSESVLDRREQERRSAYAAAPAPAPAPSAGPFASSPAASPPAIAAAPAVPGAAPFGRSESAANATGSIARGGSPNADVASAPFAAASPRAAAARSASVPINASPFSALDRWTSFDLARAGAQVRHARGDIEGLAALVNTVARSATAADAPLAAPVEARLSLQQGGTTLAVLEIAGDQVRWTPQPGGAASVGTPPAQALDALRALLAR